MKRRSVLLAIADQATRDAWPFAGHIPPTYSRTELDRMLAALKRSHAGDTRI
jgi:hypothetical protein